MAPKTVECICGEEQELENLADHLRKEHLGSDLPPYSCGVCGFLATSESGYLAHCASREHDPRLDKKSKVRLLRILWQ